jgi:hypothetical protein
MHAAAARPLVHIGAVRRLNELSPAEAYNLWPHSEPTGLMRVAMRMRLPVPVVLVSVNHAHNIAGWAALFPWSQPGFPDVAFLGCYTSKHWRGSGFASAAVQAILAAEQPATICTQPQYADTRGGAQRMAHFAKVHGYTRTWMSRTYSTGFADFYGDVWLRLDAPAAEVV